MNAAPGQAVARLLQVPFESLRRTTRDRKYVIDEVQSVMGRLREGGGAGAGPRSREEQAQVLDSAVKRLQSLKRKACDPFLLSV
jgi:macrophage erythroblast attacher